jgi:hypothetical protein
LVGLPEVPAAWKGLKFACWNWAVDGELGMKLVRPKRRPTVVNSTHLPGCGLKIVVRSFSMASKKSVKAFAVSTFGVSELELSGAVAAGVDDAYAESKV